MPQPRTLFDKIWQDHLVHQQQGGTCLLYIDRHLIHEVTSPQAFEGLRQAGRKVRRPEATLAVPDHNVPTCKDERLGVIEDEASRIQVEVLDNNANEFGVNYFTMNDKRQGIVHVSGPEQGFTLPGTTIVCGDSHTSTHGAFGALAFGIGTSEVEHVLATQTLIQKPAKNMLIEVSGKLEQGVTAKDVVLAIIRKIGTAGGTGYVIEYAGEVIRSLSMEERMTICNMSIEAGARAGLIAPDQTTYDYLQGRNFSPKDDNWHKALQYWQTLPSDEGATYDSIIKLDMSGVPPQITWGTSPQDVIDINGIIPSVDDFSSESRKAGVTRALEYMGLTEYQNQKITDVSIDSVFIGSCTNSRIEDLRASAKATKSALDRGMRVADHVHAFVVPGSGLVKEQAEQEGLDKIFTAAGFEWRMPGCSMCLAMNSDKLKSGERCVSTSNRNFEGRQGRGGRTHLASPVMAVASAVRGKISDHREVLK